MDKKRFWLLVGILLVVFVLILFLMPNSRMIRIILGMEMISFIKFVFSWCLIFSIIGGPSVLALFWYHMGFPKIKKLIKEDLGVGEFLLLSALLSLLVGEVWLALVPPIYLLRDMGEKLYSASRIFGFSKEASLYWFNHGVLGFGVALLGSAFTSFILSMD